MRRYKKEYQTWSYSILISKLKQTDINSIYSGPLYFVLWVFCLELMSTNILVRLFSEMKPMHFKAIVFNITSCTILVNTLESIWMLISVVQVSLMMKILHQCWFVSSSLFWFFLFLGWTPLHEASSEGSNDIIVELLKDGANVNCENLHGILPIHDAVANNHLKVQYTSDYIPFF